MQNNSLAQLQIPLVIGNHIEKLPEDLFIPPNALEVILESTPILNQKRRHRYS